jgi:hypothetical protein
MAPLTDGVIGFVLIVVGGALLGTLALALLDLWLGEDEHVP